MKKIILLLVCLLSTNTFANKSNHTNCSEKAIKGAVALFDINNHNPIDKQTKIKTSTKLVSQKLGESGLQVWDVSIQQDDVKYSPYRMTLLTDDCIIIGFKIPLAS
jgi:hypothetical protein